MMRKSIVRRSHAPPDIPTASTADVAFLLILFFMVTTVFRATTLHLAIKLPQARSTERILIRRNVSYILVDANRKIYIDDNIIPEDRISDVMTPKVIAKEEEGEYLTTILNVDEAVNYGTVDVVLDHLKTSKAFRITFATEYARF
jgi:biopolymer transport protein ExbD